MPTPLPLPLPFSHLSPTANVRRLHRLGMPRRPLLGLLLFLALFPATAAAAADPGICTSEEIFSQGDTYLLMGANQVFLARPSDHQHVEVQKRSASDSDPDSYAADFTWNSQDHHRKGSKFLAATRGELDSNSPGDEVALAFFDADSRLQVMTMNAPADQNSTWNSEEYDPQTYFAWDQSSKESGPLAIATGDLDKDSEGDEIVLAYFADKELRVKLVSTAKALDPGGSDPTLAYFKNSDHHRDGSEIAVAVASLAPGDPPKIVVGLVDGERRIQVIVLEYESDSPNLNEMTYASGGQDQVAIDDDILGTYVASDGRGTLRGSFDMTLAHLDNDLSDEIVVVYRDQAAQSAMLQVAYSPEIQTGSTTVPASLTLGAPTLLGTDVSRNYLAAGDVDADGLDELVLFGALSPPASDPSVFITVLEPGLLGFESKAKYSWQSSSDTQTWWPQDVAVADTNLDGFSEVIVSLTQMERVKLSEDHDDSRYWSVEVQAFETRVLDASGGSLVNVETWSDSVSSDNSLQGKTFQMDGITSLALADANDRNVYGQATGERNFMDSPQIRALIQTPPSWTDPPKGSTSFSTTASVSHGESTSSTTSYGGNLTYSMGLSLTDAFEIGGSISTSIQQATTVSTSEQVQYVTGHGYSVPSTDLDTGYNSVVVHDTVSYDCYGFDVYQGGSRVTVTDPSGKSHYGQVQSCLAYCVNTVATDLGTWTHYPDDYPSWVPLSRSWTRPNLAQSAVSVSQSNVTGDSPCDPEVTVNGSPDSKPCTATPATGESAWWQAELQEPTSGRPTVTSLVFSTAQPLYNFWVYIGDEMDAEPPADALNSNGTWNSTSSLDGTGWTFVPTTAPPSFELALAGEGRYVRVLGAQGAPLSLREVQILGAQQLDDQGHAQVPTPDEFPNCLSDGGGDGWLELGWGTSNCGDSTGGSGSSRAVIGQLWALDQADTPVACHTTPEERTFTFSQTTGTSSGTQAGANVAVGGSLKIGGFGLSATGTYGFQEGNTVAYSDTESLEITVKAAGVETGDLPFSYRPFLFFRPIMSTSGALYLVLETDHLVTALGSTPCSDGGS